MTKPLLADELWAIVAPLLPPEPGKPTGGCPRVPDRACLTGILFVLRSGIPWEYLPQELGCGSGVTCWRRMTEGKGEPSFDGPPGARVAWSMRRSSKTLQYRS